MITIKDFMETIEYKISDGAQYQWYCFGSDAWMISYEELENDNTIQIVYDTVNQTVYEMQAWDVLRKKEYRWINPDYIKAYKDESLERGVPVNESIDGRTFVDLEVEEDMLEKASAIYQGVEYDSRVAIQLNLPNEKLFSLMQMAHEKDMTFNQFVEDMLREYIREQGIEI